ncbi:HNH endonuclease signature motif containing protein [Streptomyces salyersiae]|uniref:HNH endonuclease signature motif containing protein n=1 Tax=Streptomyces salyersiae TaxID=3075530 RepID=A0ABU2RD09_9ACTN|nr:HNH endonuclease signature motif containing protein [Streptomyces sp. DSM 41770]MDT0426153.1 HNH endonuclease signature motif containing protein [Streptomyces sp. DSM 41770]
MSRSKRYTREQLVSAAEQCSDIDEVIAFFGTPPYGHLRRYLTRRFAHYGIDVSHFTPRGSATVASRPDRGMLCEAVASSRSWAELLRELGRPDNGHQRGLLRRWTAEEAIATSHFLGQAHQRGRPAPKSASRPEDVLVRHAGKRRTKTASLRRALAAIGVPDRCDGCGSDPVWRGDPITLEIDHINGDWSDDRPENLRLLCPNCHAVTSTWCRGGARSPVLPADSLTTSAACPVR